MENKIIISHKCLHPSRERLIPRMNITEIVKRGLCHGCGTCVSVCPMHAIQMHVSESLGVYSAKVNTSLCNNCGACVDICPGRGFRFHEESVETPVHSLDLLTGHFQACYIGSSSDAGIRFHSSSGGLVTQLLTHLLDKQQIDAAIVAVTNPESSFRPMPCIVTTCDGVQKAAQSKYAPIPINMVLTEALENYDKIAIVGLPCHIQGARNLARKYRYRGKIVYYFSLFCNHTPNFFAYNSYLNHQGVDCSTISETYHRGFGWPGLFRIVIESVKVIDRKWSDNWGYVGSHFFYPKRCFVCTDATGEMSDLSFGDPWLPEYHNESLGLTLVMARSDRGNQILKDALADGVVELKLTHKHDVVRSQASLLYRKKKMFTAKCLLLGIRPSYDNHDISRLSDYLQSLYPVFTNTLVNSRIGRKLRWYMPPTLLVLVQKLYNIVQGFHAKKYVRSFLDQE